MPGFSVILAVHYTGSILYMGALMTEEPTPPTPAFPAVRVPACFAHRGASGHSPENTMLAFRYAFELGADAIECDVQLSADGAPVIIHDSTVDRTTNGSGIVTELS